MTNNTFNTIENITARALETITVGVVGTVIEVGAVPYAVGRGIIKYATGVVDFTSSLMNEVKREMEEENIKKQRVVTWLTVD